MRGMRKRTSSELAARGKKTLTCARNNTTSCVLSYCGEKKKKIALFFLNDSRACLAALGQEQR